MKTVRVERGVVIGFGKCQIDPMATACAAHNHPRCAEWRDRRDSDLATEILNESAVYAPPPRGEVVVEGIPALSVKFKALKPGEYLLLNGEIKNLKKRVRTEEELQPLLRAQAARISEERSQWEVRGMPSSDALNLSQQAFKAYELKLREEEIECPH